MPLTSLSQVKRRLQLSSNDDDALLSALVDQISARIERVCRRTFDASDYSEWHRIDNNRIIVDQWPIIRLHRVATGHRDAMDIEYDGSGISAQVYSTEDDLRLIDVDSNGDETTNEFTYSTYKSIDALATQINAQANWSATVNKNLPASWIRPFTADDIADGGTVAVECADDPIFARVQEESGVLWTERKSTANPALVQYRAGFAEIPSDVEYVANELVADAYHASGETKTTVQQEQLGDWSYQLASNAQMTRRMLNLLAPYMRRGSFE